MDVPDYVEQLRRDGERLATVASFTDPRARVPTCPDWSLRDLVRHVGGVHRWATGFVRGAGRQPPDGDLERFVGGWPEDTELVVAHTSSGAEALARKAPRARVVSAFGTVPSEVLFGVFAARRRKTRPTLIYCGDDPDANGVAAELIRDAGFEPMDAGPLRIARCSEPFTLLVARLAYEGDGGPALAYRFERFPELEA